MGELLSCLVRGGLITAGLLLPGLGWALALRCPLPVFSAGVFSALAIFAGVLALDATGIAITLGSLGWWLGAVAVFGGAWSWRIRYTITPERPDFEGWWLALPAVPAVLVAIWRALAHSLPGADVDFRWGHLARLIVEEQSLAFYPPVTDQSFALYFWADGIAPLVSSIYAWTYLAAGSVDRMWTAIPVLFQFAGLYALLYVLGRHWGGSRAGWLACGLGGATMLLQFSFGLGQETGLTTLGVGGMVYSLMKWRESRDLGALVAAVACGALTACAREYGLVFLLLGIGWVFCSSGKMREKIGYAAAAAALPVCWHVRNWMMTGNPFYCQDFAGVFPVNPAFDAWMKAYAEIHGAVWRGAEGWTSFLRYLLIGSIPGLLGFGAGILILRNRSHWDLWLCTGFLAVVVWMASVPYTAGGLFYSMRVLGPLLLLGCAWGAYVIISWSDRRYFVVIAACCILIVGIDSALRALTIPMNPYRLKPQEWLRVGDWIRRDFIRDDLPFLREIASMGGGKILSDSAGVQDTLRQNGRTVAPLWTPEASFLFDPTLSQPASRRLMELGYSHILIKRSEFSLDFLVRQGLWQRLGPDLQPQSSNDTFVYFRLVESSGATETTGGLP